MKCSFPFFRTRNPNELKLILHIGPWKTGTTAIQNVLLRAGDGIIYPHPLENGPGHHSLAMELMDPECGKGERNLVVQTVKREASKSPGKPVVLSSETFSSATSHPHMAARLSDLPDFIHTDLVITVRPVPHKVYSILQEQVKQGWIHDFKGQEIDWKRFISRFHYHDLDIDSILGLGRWRACHFVLTDPGRPYFIIDAFSDILGVPLPRSLDLDWANKAMPYMQMLILLDLHRTHPGHDTNALFERSGVMFSELQESDPAKAVTPYPPFPEDVIRHFETLDANLTRRILELEREGRAVVHRPKED